MFKGIFAPFRVSLGGIQNLKKINNFAFSSEINFAVKFKDKPEIPPINIKGSIGAVLAKTLKDHKVPLAFECGFSCECATCAIKFGSPNDYDEILKAQPIEIEEKVTLKSENAPEGTRLSCQMKICKEMENKTFLI